MSLLNIHTEEVLENRSAPWPEVDFINLNDTKEFLLWAKSRYIAQSKLRSYSHLAERGNFKSRAYVREVFTGKRKLTFEALSGFTKMLKLSKWEGNFLTTLLEQERCRPGAKLKIENLRLKYRKTLFRKTRVLNRESNITARSLKVYAAISPSIIRNQIKIEAITGLSSTLVKKEIGILLAEKWIVQDQAGYRSENSHLVLKEMKDENFLKSWVIDDLRTASSVANSNFTDSQNVFLTSKFTIHAEQQASLNQALREAFSRWIEQNMADDGDKLVTFSMVLIGN